MAMKMKKVMKAGEAMLDAMGKSEMATMIATELEKSRVKAEKEIAKAKKKIDATLAKAENFVKSNPEKAAMIAASIGAALGSALTLYATHKKKPVTKKKK